MKRFVGMILLIVILLSCQAAWTEETEVKLRCIRYEYEMVHAEPQGDVDVDVFRDGQNRNLLYVYVEIGNSTQLQEQYGGRPEWSYEYTGEISEGNLPIDVYYNEAGFQLTYTTTAPFPGEIQVQYALTCKWGEAVQTLNINLNFREPAMGVPGTLLLTSDEMVVKAGEYFDDFVTPDYCVDVENWELPGCDVFTNMMYDHQVGSLIQYDSALKKYHIDVPGIYSLKLLWYCANYQLEADYQLVVLDENGNRPTMPFQFGFMFQPWSVYYLEGEPGDYTTAQVTIDNYNAMQEKYGGQPRFTLEKLQGPDDFSYTVDTVSTGKYPGSVYLKLEKKPTKEGVSKFRLTGEWGESLGTVEFEVSAEKLLMGLPSDVTGVPAQMEVELYETFEVNLPKLFPEDWQGNYGEPMNTTIWYDSVYSSEAIRIEEWKEDSFVLQAVMAGTHEISIGRKLADSNLEFKMPLKLVITNPEGVLTDAMVRFYQQALMVEAGDEFDMYYHIVDASAVEEAVWTSDDENVLTMTGNHLKALKNGKTMVRLTLKGKDDQKVTRSVEVQVGPVNTYHLPDHLKRIDAEAFSGAGSAVHRVALGKEVEYIDAMAFGYGPMLNSVYFEGDLPNFAENNYGSIYYKAVIICPFNSQLHRILENSTYMYMTH